MDVQCLLNLFCLLWIRWVIRGSSPFLITTHNHLMCCHLGVEISTAKCADLEYPDRNIPDDLCGFLADSRPQPLVRWCSMGPCPPKYDLIIVLQDSYLFTLVFPSPSPPPPPPPPPPT